MIRYKWVNCEWPVSIRDIATILMSNSFDHDNSCGFKLDMTRMSFVSGRYIVKHNIEEKINDPLTDTITVTNRIMYDIVNFNLSSCKPTIEVINPPRSLNGFISALGDAIKTNITISNIEINIIDCIDLLNKNLKKVKVTMIDCSNIIINFNTSAKLTITGSDDVRSQLTDMLGTKLYSAEKARISFMNESGVMSWFEITNKGSAKIANRDTEVILPVLKDCISTLSK